MTMPAFDQTMTYSTEVIVKDQYENIIGIFPDVQSVKVVSSETKVAIWTMAGKFTFNYELNIDDKPVYSFYSFIET
jgi:hypothetical protein